MNEFTLRWPEETAGAADFPPGHPDAPPPKLDTPLPEGFEWGLTASGKAVPVRRVSLGPEAPQEPAQAVSRGLSRFERGAIVCTACGVAAMASVAGLVLAVGHGVAAMAPALPAVAEVAKWAAVAVALTSAAFVLRRFSRGSVTVHNESHVTNHVSSKWRRPKVETRAVQSK